MPPSGKPLNPAWQKLADGLQALSEEIRSGHTELNRFAHAFTVMVNDYHRAVQLTGKTSIRIRAMCKALDLATPKSELVAFVGDEHRGRQRDGSGGSGKGPVIN